MSVAEEARKELERIKGIYKDCDPSKLRLAEGLMGKAAFLKAQLDSLERKVSENGPIQRSSRGNARVSPTYKAYLQTVSAYQAAVRAIDRIMGGSAEEGDDQFDEFMKKAMEESE